jgi:hypothetical protein
MSCCWILNQVDLCWCSSKVFLLKLLNLVLHPSLGAAHERTSGIDVSRGFRRCMRYLWECGDFTWWSRGSVSYCFLIAPLFLCSPSSYISLLYFIFLCIYHIDLSESHSINFLTAFAELIKGGYLKRSEKDRIWWVARHRINCMRCLFYLAGNTSFKWTNPLWLYTWATFINAN